MSRVQLLAVCAALVAAVPAQAAPVAAPNPAVENDVQCLLLYLAAAGGKDEKVRQAAIAGSWYFLGKLDIRSPGLDLVRELNNKAAALQGNPKAEEIGTACDAELSKRGGELMKIGEQLQHEKH